MPTRAPTQADFPPHLTLSITPPPPSPSPSPSSAPSSILLILHGLGDTHTPLTRLAQSMRLPSTLCICLRAPTPLPFALNPDSYHWGDDIVIDPADPTGGVDIRACGYATAVRMVLGEVIQGVLLGKCGYKPREVVMMGLGQGGTVGLGVAERLAREGGAEGSARELGGVISLGGAAPVEVVRGTTTENERSRRKCRTPVLVCHGSSRSAITTDRAREIRQAFEFVEFARWERPGDGMATNREEMMPIMRFFGRTLRSRAGVPDGAEEIG